MSQGEERLLAAALVERLGTGSQLSSAEQGPRLISRFERPASRVYRFAWDSRPADMVVKVPHLHTEASASSPRPRVVPRNDPATKHRFEVRALAQAQRYLEAAQDPRFRPVRLLTTLDDPQAIVTEFLPWPSLHRLHLRTITTRMGRDRTLQGFENAGAWLAAYHASAPLPEATPRDRHPTDYIEKLELLVAHVRRELGGDGLHQEAADLARRRAADLLPDPVPLATAHGDFGPANILVGDGGEVAVLDLIGRWLAPPEEDLAYCLTSIRSSKAVLLTRSPVLSSRLLDAAEAAFLHGYYGDSPVSPSLPLFRVNALLDVWGSRLQRWSGWRRRLAGGAFGRQLDRVGEDLLR